MINKVKVSAIILSGLLFISLVLAGSANYTLKQERQKSALLKQDLEGLKSKYGIIESKFNESKKRLLSLESSLKLRGEQVEALTKELEQEKTGKQEALAQTEQLKTDLEQQKTSRSDLEIKLTSAEDQTKRLQGQLAELETKRGELEAKIKELEEKTKYVELGKIVVSPENENTELSTEVTVKEEKPLLSNLEGKVLVINKEYDFVVINLGGKDGINTGDALSVFRDEKYIGDIKVEKVHDSMSSAGFSAELRDKINEGDKVVWKNK